MPSSPRQDGRGTGQGQRSTEEKRTTLGDVVVELGRGLALLADLGGLSGKYHTPQIGKGQVNEAIEQSGGNEERDGASGGKEKETLRSAPLRRFGIPLAHWG